MTQELIWPSISMVVPRIITAATHLPFLGLCARLYTIISITVRKREGTYHLLEDQHPSHQNTIGCLQMIFGEIPNYKKNFFNTTIIERFGVPLTTGLIYKQNRKKQIFFRMFLRFLPSDFRDFLSIFHSSNPQEDGYRKANHWLRLGFPSLFLGLVSKVSNPRDWSPQVRPDKKRRHAALSCSAPPAPPAAPSVHLGYQGGFKLVENQ